jgi:DNA-binding NarL/FixJ family response regulator
MISTHPRSRLSDRTSRFWLSVADEWSAIAVSSLRGDGSDADCASTGLAGLSPSELEVVEDAAKGLTVNESAARRTTSPAAVKARRAAALAKLRARNIAHAIALISRHNIYSDYVA